MKPETIETLIWIFAIVVFTGLTTKLLLDSRSLSCDKCEVTLTNTVAGGQPYEFGTFNVQELFDEYEDGHCTVSWSSTGGYSYG
jgi:hypothetical protein